MAIFFPRQYQENNKFMLTVNILKFEKCDFHHTMRIPKDAEGMANSVDPDLYFRLLG